MILAFNLYIIAAVCIVVMDTLQFHYKDSIFKDFNPKWWNPKISWRNKYKNGDPEQGEAFYGSTTILVGLTDAWHMSKTFMLISFSLAITIGLFGVSWVGFLTAPILLGVYGIVYEFLNNKFYD